MPEQPVGASASDQLWEEEQRARTAGQKPWWQGIRDVLAYGPIIGGVKALTQTPQIRQRVAQDIGQAPQRAWDVLQWLTPAGVEGPMQKAIQTTAAEAQRAAPLFNHLAGELPKGIPLRGNWERYTEGRRPLDFKKVAGGAEADLYRSTLESPSTPSVKEISRISRYTGRPVRIDASVVDEAGNIVDPNYRDLKGHELTVLPKGQQGRYRRAPSDVWHGVSGRSLDEALSASEGGLPTSAAAVTEAVGEPVWNAWLRRPTFDKPSYVVRRDPNGMVKQVFELRLAEESPGRIDAVHDIPGNEVRPTYSSAPVEQRIVVREIPTSRWQGGRRVPMGQPATSGGIPIEKWLEHGYEVPAGHPRPYRGWLLSDGKIISIGEKFEDGSVHGRNASLVDHYDVENSVTRRPNQTGYIDPAVRFSEESVARLSKVTPDEVSIEFFGYNIKPQQVMQLQEMLATRPNARFIWEISDPATKQTVAWGTDLTSLAREVQSRRTGVPSGSR